MEWGNRRLDSVMSSSIPSSASTKSSISAGQALSEVRGGEVAYLDEPGTLKSGHNPLEGDEIVTGGENPKGGNTGGESSPIRALSLPLTFGFLVKVSSEL